MRPHITSALIALFAAGCVSQAQPQPDYAGEYVGQSSGPGDVYDETAWVGPPGGGMDPGYGYDDPNAPPSGQTGDLGASPDGMAMYEGSSYGGAESTDPTALAPATGGATVLANATMDVTDAEIDTTLQPYGEWVTDADYGNVWRPYTSVVGADFTPYESCGSWVYTDYGWTFQSCNEWSWGWLPFHYGRWVYLDNSWCWTRDYSWGPGWVDWRHGRDYVGWRPSRPTRQIRDHRDRHNGPSIRDHRRGDNERWRFSDAKDFGRKSIRDSRPIDVREGLRSTTAVAHPSLRGDRRERASAVMGSRFASKQRYGARGEIGQSTRGYQPTFDRSRPSTAFGGRTPRGNPGTYSPGTVQGVRTPGQPSRSWQQPGQRGWQQPSRTYQQPQRGQWQQQPPRAYQAPTRGTYQQPPRTYQAPTRNTYQPPTRGTYQPPSRSTYQPPSRTYQAPTRSAPSRNYSPPSRPSSSSSSPSRSSGSYSAPSRSSGSSSSGSSRSSSSSGGSRGRHR